MGDRPEVPNVCLILTNAKEDDMTGFKQFRHLKFVCNHLVILNHGGSKDLQKVPAAVCPCALEAPEGILSLIIISQQLK